MRRVRKTLLAHPAVHEVDIDFHARTAWVAMDPGTDPSDVAAALTGRYSGTVRSTN